MKPAITPGCTATVNLASVAACDSAPPYMRLVRRLIKLGDGKVYVASVPPNATNDPSTQAAYIRSWRGDLIGDVRVPLAALTPSP